MDRPEDRLEMLGALSADEFQLLEDYRGCSNRRKDVIARFTRKLSKLAVAPNLNHQPTNILPFRRRRDD
jgi:hypothetical protein